MILEFICNLRKPKLKRNVVVQNIKNGGIKVEACRTSWIQGNVMNQILNGRVHYQVIKM